MALLNFVGKNVFLSMFFMLTPPLVPFVLGLLVWVYKFILFMF
jgi:hypothetical protein